MRKMGKKVSTGILWTCPYYKWSEEYALHCRCGVIQFPDRREMLDYTRDYCAAEAPGYEKCSLCKMAQRYYLIKGNEEGEELNAKFK